MINYVEKGIGLHGLIESSGHRLEQSDGVWISDDDVAVQAIIDSYPASATAAPIIAEIKMHAREIILTRYPEWKQANMTARSVELTEKLASGTALTVDEQGEIAAMKNVWAWIKTIRVASNEREAAINAFVAASDYAGILSYDWRTGWPE